MSSRCTSLSQNVFLFIEEALCRVEQITFECTTHELIPVLRSWLSQILKRSLIVDEMPESTGNEIKTLLRTFEEKISFSKGSEVKTQ